MTMYPYSIYLRGSSVCDIGPFGTSWFPFKPSRCSGWRPLILGMRMTGARHDIYIHIYRIYTMLYYAILLYIVLIIMGPGKLQVSPRPQEPLQIQGRCRPSCHRFTDVSFGRENGSSLHLAARLPSLDL